MPMMRRSCSSAKRARLERDLAPGAGRAVHPHDGGAAGVAELGEGEPSATAHGDRTLEPRAIDARSCPRIVRTRAAARRVRGVSGTVRHPDAPAGSTHVCGGSRTAPHEAHRPTDPSAARLALDRRGEQQVTLSRPPAARAASSSSPTAASSWCSPRIRSMSGSRTRSVSPSLASSTRSPATQVELGREVARSRSSVTVDAAGDHVAPRVVGNVSLVERALVDEALHDGVVVRHPGRASRPGRGSRASRPRARARTARRRWRSRSASWPSRRGRGRGGRRR